MTGLNAVGIRANLVRLVDETWTAVLLEARVTGAPAPGPAPGGWASVVRRAGERERDAEWKKQRTQGHAPAYCIERASAEGAGNRSDRAQSQAMGSEKGACETDRADRADRANS